MDRPWFGNGNLTARKALYFGVASGIGAGILTGLTYLLTEVAGLWYLVSTVIGGGVAFAVKFVVNALWTFRN